MHHEPQLFVSDVLWERNDDFGKMVVSEDLKVLVSLVEGNRESVGLVVLLLWLSNINLVHLFN